jgi:hypothetical protein
MELVKFERGFAVPGDQKYFSQHLSVSIKNVIFV